MRTHRLPKQPKNRVVRARCDALTEQTLKRAAIVSNLDLSDFLRLAGLEKAARVVTLPLQLDLPGLRG